MTLEDWRESVRAVAVAYNAGDSTYADLMAQVLYEQDMAKQAIRDKGYGWIGLPWLDLIDQIPRQTRCSCR